MDPQIYDQYKVQSALQSQSVAQQSAVSGPELQQAVQQVQAQLIEALDPRKVAKQILLELQGLEQLPNGTYQKISDPVMNDQGIAEMRYILRGLINQHMTLTYYEEQDIRRRMVNISDSITAKIGVKWKEWEMEESDKDVVVDIVLTNVDAIFRRSLEKNEKNLIGRIVMEFLNPGGNVDKPQGKGFLDKFKL